MAWARPLPLVSEGWQRHAVLPCPEGHEMLKIHIVAPVVAMTSYMVLIAIVLMS
jgi:hypothetical protein